MEEQSQSQKNQKDYNKGKAKLQNAVIIQPDDKIYNFIHKNINHRFWISDYSKFKKNLAENEGMAAGMGNPEAPTPTSDGSGDKFEKETKKKKEEDKKETMYESLGDGTENFEESLGYSEISLYNSPIELGEIDTYHAKVKYVAELELNRSAIEGIIFNIKHIDLTIETQHYSPEDVDGDNPIEEHKNFVIIDPDAQMDVQHLPWYLTDLDIDMKHSMDTKVWVIKAQFGRDRDY